MKKGCEKALLHSTVLRRWVQPWVLKKIMSIEMCFCGKGKNGF